MKRYARYVTTLLLALPAIAHAHPETGFLPDAIAETEYRIVLEITPKDCTTRNRLGIVLYRKNKLKEAAQQFAEVLKIIPADFDAHDGMGLVRSKEGNPTEAINWFRKAIAIKRDDTLIHYNLGLAYEKLGRFAEAESSYKESLAVNGALLKRGINRELETGKTAMIQAALKNIQIKMKTGR
jgi:Flp pilus assembly protein TadD